MTAPREKEPEESEGEERLVNWRVPRAKAGTRLDRLLPEICNGMSRAWSKELIEGGFVTVDGEVRAARYRVAMGERVLIRLLARHMLRAGSDRPLPELRVIFEDDWILVIDKQPGVSAHPGGSVLWGTISQAATKHCGTDLPTVSGADRPGIVHRLDKDTSGAMVLAKTEPAFVDLQAQFRQRQVTKEYRAIVYGEPRFFSDYIEGQIARDPRHPERMRVVKENGREASTYYERVEVFRGFAHLLCKPKTGRTHQIRVHLSSIALPLVGDPTYRPRGSQGKNLPQSAPDPGRHCLHARALAFRHPVSGVDVGFEAPLPPDLDALLAWLRANRASGGTA